MNEEKMNGLIKINNSKIISKIQAAQVFCKNNKFKLLCGFACTAIVAVFFLYMILSSGGKSKLILSFETFDSAETLDAGAVASPVIALNRTAKSAKFSGAKPATAYFVFSKEQKKNILQELLKTAGGQTAGGSCAFELSLCVDKISSKRIETLKNASAQIPFSFGYLYETDFSNGKLKKSIESRPLVSADLLEFASENGEDFTAGMCLPHVSDGSSSAFTEDKPEYSKNIPCGFFVHCSSLPVRLSKITFGTAKIGFDTEKAFYSFAPNGGTFSKKMTSFDFSGASLVFPAQNTKTTVLPQYLIKFAQPEESPLAIEKINFGSEKFKFYRTKSKNQPETEVIPGSVLQNPFVQVDFKENESVSSIIMSASNPELLTFSNKDVLEPIVCDPGLIIGCKITNWRGNDYELFQWNAFPGVLIFDTRSYAIQDAFFRRLAFYVEKAGYRGKLLTDMELGSKHGYNAHDYSAESLASFFTKAQNEGFALNQKEYLLCEILLANGVIKKSSDGKFEAGRGAVISISQESQEYLRRQFMAHECWHGIFFINPDFRNAVAAVYYTMDQTCLDFLKVFWATQPDLGYDLQDTYLMHNELMAYLMQQGISVTANYYLSLAKRPSVQRNQKELADYVLATNAVGFEDAAKILDTYAFDNWCFNAGRIWLVSR